MSNGNTWEFVRRAQLARLVETLNDVLAILRLDQQCAWTAQFEQFLQTAKHFSDAGFTQAELVEFSHSVGRIFDPYDGGFRNYRPPAGLPAEGMHGTDNFETFTRAAWQQAFQLRVISGPMWKAPTQFR